MVLHSSSSTPRVWQYCVPESGEDVTFCPNDIILFDKHSIGGDVMMEKEYKLIFTVPGIPPSYSKSFKINYGLKQTYLSQDAKRFKDRVKEYMPYWSIPDDEQLKFSMHNEYHFGCYYKNKRIKKHDVQNMNRLLIDAVFDKIGYDDKHLFKVTDEKVQDCEEKTVVSIWTVVDRRYEI